MRISFFDDEESMAEKFAKTLMDNWGVGYAGCNNGVVLFVSINDRVLHIYAGKGARNKLNDNVLD